MTRVTRSSPAWMTLLILSVACVMLQAEESVPSDAGEVVVAEMSKKEALGLEDSSEESDEVLEEDVLKPVTEEGNEEAPEVDGDDDQDPFAPLDSEPLVVAEGGQIADDDNIESGEVAPVPLPEEEEEAVIIDEGILPPTNANAGPGSVVGEVYDEESGSGLAGVIVSAPFLGNFRVRTDEDGRFSMKGLPLGSNLLKFTKSGFISSEQQVEITSGETSTKVSQALVVRPIELDDEEYLMEDYEVVVEYEEESGTEIIFETAGGASLVSGLSKEDFSNQGVSDAAGAVSKISGANVVGGKFVVVRGLGDRYNNTTLNGGIVPSPETSRKAVQLDLFPSDLLQAVAIAKTATPDLPADFVGGLVALQTLQIPEEDYITVGLSTKYHVPTHRQGSFTYVPSLDIPDNIAATSPIISGDPILDSSKFTATRGADAQEARQRFFDKVKYNTLERDPEMDRGISLGFGKTIDLNHGNRLAFVGSFTYETKDRYRRQEESRWGGTLSIDPNDVSRLDSRFADLSSLREPLPGASSFTVNGLTGNYERDIFTRSKEAGLLLGSTLELGDLHKFNVAFFKFRSGESEYSTTQGGIIDANQLAEQSERLVIQDFIVEGDRLDGDYEMLSHRDTYELIFRELQFYQVGGDHTFIDDRGPSIRWNLYNGSTNEARPSSYELNGYDLTRVDGDGPNGFTIANITNDSISPKSTFIESDIADDSFQLKLDGDIPLIDLLDDSRRLSVIFGLDSFNRTRDSSLTNAAVELGRRARRTDGGIDATSGENGLTSGNPTVDDQRASTSTNPIASRSGSEATPEYTGETTVNSLYAGIDSDWDEWVLQAGVRFEDESRDFTVPSDNAPSGGGGDSDFFPSIRLGRTFGDDDQFSLDLAYSRTVVRPTFYEFIPADILDVSNDQVFRGNRDLRQSSAENYDARLTWNGQSGDYFGITAFYKVIEDPIFTIRDPLEADILTFANLGETTVKGIELEGQKILGAGFSLSGNFSVIDGDAEPGLVRQGSNFFLGKFDRLEGQPTWLGNLILSYENVDSKLNANLIYNYTGDYQTVGNLSRVGDPDFGSASEIREPFQTLDFNISKGFETSWADLKLKLSVENILNSKEEVRYEGTSDEFRPRTSYEPGRSYGISLDIDF